MLLRLPQELIEMIIDEVDEKDRRKLLSRCSVVSRNWLHRFRRLLFKSVCICEPALDDRQLIPPASPGESKVHSFLQLLNHSPEIAACVQSLSIMGRVREHCSNVTLKFINSPVLKISDLSQYLACLPNLSSLELHSMFLQEYRTISTTHHPVYSLKTLRLINLQGHHGLGMQSCSILGLFGLFTDIHSLVLDGLFIGVDGTTRLEQKVNIAHVQVVAGRQYSCVDLLLDRVASGQKVIHYELFLSDLNQPDDYEGIAHIIRRAREGQLRVLEFNLRRFESWNHNG